MTHRHASATAPIPTAPIPAALAPTGPDPIELSDAQRQFEDMADAVLDSLPMTPSMLDGYLAGVAVCPTRLPPEVWLPPICDGADDDDAGVVDTELVFALSEVFYSEIVADLDDGTYGPLFDLDTDDTPIWEPWLAGFALAFTLAPDAWATLDNHRDDVVSGAALAMVRLIELALAPDGAVEPELPDAMLEENAPDMIATAVSVLHRARVAGRRGGVRRHAKIGRNAPCPCGSGRKYKKCCGG
jgi:uncharacterized protein